MPSSGRGYTENLSHVRKWQERFALTLFGFCKGLDAGKPILVFDPDHVTDQAFLLYEDQYRKLAAQVPEFLVWTLLNESAATRGLVASAHEDVKTALTDQVGAMSRLESLLRAVCGAVPDQVSALHRAASAGLDETVVMRDPAVMTVLTDIRFPLVREIFVQPGYRCERVDGQSRIADEQWWQSVPAHHDLDLRLRLTTHLTSAEAPWLPLLLLGHPGAGKSLLVKVLAARLPSDQYTTRLRATPARVQHRSRSISRSNMRWRGRPKAGWTGRASCTRARALVPHLAGATAAAAGTAAYGVITSSFWKLADALSPLRLAAVTVVAALVMTVWLIVYNHLWDRPSETADRRKALMYNVSTATTLAIGVACMYVILFALALLAAVVLIDSDYLAQTLGHPVGVGSYLNLVWLGSSIGIVAGALGSSLEDEETVRKATYSRHERERQERNRCRRDERTSADRERLTETPPRDE